MKEHDWFLKTFPTVKFFRDVDGKLEDIPGGTLNEIVRIYCKKCNAYRDYNKNKQNRLSDFIFESKKECESYEASEE